MEHKACSRQPDRRRGFLRRATPDGAPQREGGAHQTRRTAEFGGHDPHAADEGQVGRRSQRFAQRVEQQRAGLRDPPANHHQVEIADRPDRRDRRRDRGRPPLNALNATSFPASAASASSLASASGRRPSRGRGPSAPSAGRTRWSLRSRARRTARLAVLVDDHMADVSGVAGSPVVRGPIEYKPSAHPGGHHHPQQERNIPSGATPMLADRHAQTVSAQPNVTTGSNT